MYGLESIFSNKKIYIYFWGKIKTYYLKKRNQEIEKNNIDESVKNYIKMKCDEFKYIRPLGLKKRYLLKELFIPLNIITNDLNNEIGSKKQVRSYIKSFEIRFFENIGKVLIEDSAGMGKSTLLKYLYLDYSEKFLNSYSGYNYIPIFIELRNLNSKKESLDDLIYENLFGELKINYSKFKKNKILYIFDGFDEIIDDLKQGFINDLNKLMQNNNNIYIISSRKELILDNLPSFKKYNIECLDYKDAEKLIKNFNNNKIPIKLFSQLWLLKEELKDIIGNPLLLTLTYRVYNYKESLPTTKSDLYSKLIDVLCEEHDVASKKGYKREIPLEKEDIKLLFSKIAMKNLNTLEIEYKNDLFDMLLYKSLKELNYSISISDLKDYILQRIAIFINNNNNWFWAHKSMQDYFIAFDIFREERLEIKQERIKGLIKNSLKNKYINILDFLLELEYEITLKEILQDIYDNYNKIECKLTKEVYMIVKEIIVIPKEESQKSFDFEKLDYQGYFERPKNIFFKRSEHYEILYLLKRKKIDIFKDIKFQERYKCPKANILLKKSKRAKMSILELSEEELQELSMIGKIDFSKIERLYLKLSKLSES